MTRDELIEKVAREISTASFVRFTPGTYAIAEAAIDVVLEEAMSLLHRRDMGDNNREDAEVRRCIETIRALKSGDE